MLPIGEIPLNGIYHHAPTDDTDSFITFTAYFTMLSVFIFRPVDFYISLPVSTHGL